MPLLSVTQTVEGKYSLPLSRCQCTLVELSAVFRY